MTPAQLGHLLIKANDYYEGDGHEVEVLLTTGDRIAGVYSTKDCSILTIDNTWSIDVSQIVAVRFYQ